MVDKGKKSTQRNRQSSSGLNLGYRALGQGSPEGIEETG